LVRKVVFLLSLGAESIVPMCAFANWYLRCFFGWLSGYRGS